MKKMSKTRLAAWVISVLPVILVGVFYTHLPEQVPMHWGFDGKVSCEAKWQLFIVALLSPVMQAMFVLLPKIDPQKKNYDKFRDGYDLFQLSMMLLLFMLVSVVIVEAFRPGTVNVPMIVSAFCSVLFILLGNMMPKFRQNYFCGIKNPWTLSSEKVWTRTHRLAGRMMFMSGLIGLCGAFVPNDIAKFITLFVPVMVASIVPTVFSYVWFRREESEPKNSV